MIRIGLSIFLENKKNHLKTFVKTEFKRKFLEITLKKNPKKP